MITVITALLLSGLMGMIGQGSRAIVGLKGLADQTADPNQPNPELFSAARLLVSLMIGFVAGAAAGLALGLDKVAAVSASDTKILLGLCAAGYAGTDFIEGFMARYLPAQAAPSAAPPLPAATLVADILPAPAPPGGDAKLRAACEAVWEANKADCSGFVRAVGAQLGMTLEGNADSIVAALKNGGVWQALTDGPAAAHAAEQGRFVVCGLTGADETVPSEHGHVAVVVGGPLNRGKYPSAYWGKLGGVGARNQTINWAWTAADRDRVSYAAYEP